MFSVTWVASFDTWSVLGYGNAAQPQTSGEIKSTEAFVIGTTWIAASQLLEDCKNVNEPIVICDDSSPAMQRLIKVVSLKLALCLFFLFFTLDS